MEQIPTPALNSQLDKEVNRRRTFAIISHPDAGKTTLTEKLLLYTGAVNQAGAVRVHKNQRSSTSDWMEMEKQRGISITSTVLQFEYEDCIFNLLDTPGHRDFSEDTYRTLMAVDSAIMVLDSAKGIEPQTKKLFEVCRQRQLPILTFINKLDHVGREPLELLDEIEQVLSLRVAPMNWPIGSGSGFQGVYDLQNHQVLLFERTTRGKFRAPVKVTNLYDPILEQTLGANAYQQLKDDAELLAGAGAPFDKDDFLSGALTPVFFGSALNNFGVEPFLEALLKIAPSPRARESNIGSIEPTNEAFSGIVFKIQAHMDPQHRDSLAFMRVCSGKFEKDMMVNHPRLGRKIRITRPHRLFARERETVDEAYPGDVIGLSNPGTFVIGDTVTSGDPFNYAPIPPFQPECFAVLRNISMEKFKQFNKGVDQLRQEGVVQVMYSADQLRREPILGAVGELQFEVIVARLQAEYNVETVIERLPYSIACWVDGDETEIRTIRWSSVSMRLLDYDKRLVVLLDSIWQLRYTIKDHPNLKFTDIAGNPFGDSANN
ncbi:MAG: peptide chain release factor 3 [Phototrophicales bacterium]|nr:peptide chain release factor 3 [Phototrophicales bacterium]